MYAKHARFEVRFINGKRIAQDYCKNLKNKLPVVWASWCKWTIYISIWKVPGTGYDEHYGETSVCTGNCLTNWVGWLWTLQGLYILAITGNIATLQLHKTKDPRMKQEVLRREKRTKVGEVVRDITFRGRGGGQEKYNPCFEGSQAVTAPPSGRGNAYDRN
jgi:hypothetical protein